MYQIPDVIEKVSATFAFCASLTLIVSGFAAVDHERQVVKKQLLSTSVIESTTNIDLTDKTVMTKNEVIGFMMSGIDKSVTIDGMVIPAKAYDPATFNYAMIRSDNYKRTYKVDKDNNVVGVVFTTYK